MNTCNIICKLAKYAIPLNLVLILDDFGDIALNLSIARSTLNSNDAKDAIYGLAAFGASHRLVRFAWGPAKALFDEIWNQLDMHQSPGDHNMALFRACLDGEFKLVESALVHKKKLIYHWEDSYVELTDIPAGIWSESSDTAPLLVTKDYYPRGAEKMMQGGSCVPLKKGQIVHGYLDTNKKEFNK